MRQLAINTNKHLIGKNNLLIKLAKDMVSSFKLEGISISIDEALKMMQESATKIEKESLLSQS